MVQRMLLDAMDGAKNAASNAVDGAKSTASDAATKATEAGKKMINK